jgi:hypothetical protein
MKAWPSGEHRDGDQGVPARGRPRSPSPPAGWAPHDERLLVETRFGGDRERYGAWRDRARPEGRDVPGDPDRRPDDAAYEEYVVATAFDGDWARYRFCRDRLRDVLWQIMRVAGDH